jgi:hypothetical protein
MMRLIRIHIFLFLLFLQVIPARAQQRFWEDVVQITGVTMTADSLRAIPDVNITVKNKNRGVTSSHYGVFSIVVAKGDTLSYTAMGFRPKEYVVPDDIEGRYFNVVQLMVQDTFYLPETIIRPRPFGDFDYAFKYWDVPEDYYSIAQRNTADEIMSMMLRDLPRSGRENQGYLQREQGNQAIYYGQQRPVGILNPLKWNEFFQAWKRGDFRKKK